jgi:pimeloyl-ACP methyl ester carboxylesterase
MRRLLRAALLLVLVWPGTALAQDKFFDSAGVQIRYVEKGSGDPIVLVHGYTSNIERSWVGPRLAAHGQCAPPRAHANSVL